MSSGCKHNIRFLALAFTQTNPQTFLFEQISSLTSVCTMTYMCQTTMVVNMHVFKFIVLSGLGDAIVKSQESLQSC